MLLHFHLIPLRSPFPFFKLFYFTHLLVLHPPNFTADSTSSSPPKKNISVFLVYVIPLFSSSLVDIFSHTALLTLAGNLFSGKTFIIYIVFQFCHVATVICLMWVHFQFCSHTVLIRERRWGGRKKNKNIVAYIWSSASLRTRATHVQDLNLTRKHNIPRNHGTAVSIV